VVYLLQVGVNEGPLGQIGLVLLGLAQPVQEARRGEQRETTKTATTTTIEKEEQKETGGAVQCTYHSAQMLE
jgi:F0F1-type ATP synthase assembly protein I